ncbi:polyprotein [Plakobranchus ocellatus]|uniref:Polyprotein n=1 Tax=Plakobranchus ocellatus TaxID=259542 RepID=A0AAV4D8P8_9GAST|nr:polyprotein [Plakobranchus ocellatus]
MMPKSIFNIGRRSGKLEVKELRRGCFMAPSLSTGCMSHPKIPTARHSLVTRHWDPHYAHKPVYTIWKSHMTLKQTEQYFSITICKRPVLHSLTGPSRLHGRFPVVQVVIPSHLMIHAYTPQVNATHLKKTYSDPTHEIPLEETTGLVWPAVPGIKFDSKTPSLQKVIAVVNKARAKSAPGPNGVPYLLYKRCPNVLKNLHKILQSVWKNINISKEWMAVEEVYITKEQDSKRTNQFRPIYC